jgi:outer membrane protein
VASAEEQLRTITGEKYNRLASPRANMPLLTPEPASEDAWVGAAMTGNASLNAARLSADIAHDSYLSAVGGHLPNITVSASRNWLLDSSNNTASVGGVNTPGALNTQDITWSAGVSVPLFTAGLTQSRVRQAKYAFSAADAGYERTQRQTEQQTRDAYQGVISQIAQVQALNQAVESNRVSLQAIEAGYEVGTKTALDVQTTRQQLVQAQTNYAQAKYGYLNNIVALRLASGALDVETVKQINGWLEEITPPAAPVATAAPATAAPAAAPATP